MTEGTWLELLLRDAGAEAFESARRSLLDAGAPTEQVEADARRALQLSDLLRERARRTRELQALAQIATRLTGVRDLDALLQDIAVQARVLLRTDLAYLALLDDDGLRIAHFDGVLHPVPPDLRLSLTAGLAGRIVDTGQPATTVDYLADVSITHLPQADSFAGTEGLRSLLGVPLHARGRTLGVLFAAERTVRSFRDAEVRLLAGLAAHAAVAIDDAELVEAERAAAAELREVNARLRTSSAAVDRAVVLHERLTEAVVRGGGPADVVRALSDVLAAPVQLLDAHDAPLAGPDLDAGRPSEQVADGRVQVLPQPGAGVLVLCPVIAAEDYLGCLVVRGSGGADDAEVRLLERGALGIALALVQQRALDEAATRSRGELLTALVEGGDPAELERRALAARVDLRRPHVVVLAETPSRGAVAELVRRAGGLLVDRAGRTLLLVPEDTDLAPLAAAGTAGASPAVCGAAALPGALAAASRCLTAALALGRTRLVATAASLGVYRFLLAGSGSGEVAEFVRRSIGALLEHDAAKGTDLARTLEEYLASGRQHTATAEALHIHPNTLYQRLGRIGSVLGEDWRDADRALDLHVALRLHRLAAALD